MPLEKRPGRPPFTNEELLHRSERYALWAMNNYGTADGGNEHAQAAASISLALSALVVARVISEHELPPGEAPTQEPDGQSTPGRAGE